MPPIVCVPNPPTTTTTTTAAPPVEYRIDPDAADQLRYIINKFNIPDDKNSNGNLQDIIKLLGDLLNALLNKNSTDAKTIISALNSILKQLENLHADLSQLIQQLMDLLDKLQKGEKFDMDELLKKLDELLNEIRKKGKLCDSKIIFAKNNQF